MGSSKESEKTICQQVIEGCQLVITPVTWFPPVKRDERVSHRHKRPTCWSRPGLVCLLRCREKDKIPNKKDPLKGPMGIAPFPSSQLSELVMFDFFLSQVYFINWLRACLAGLHLVL